MWASLQNEKHLRVCDQARRGRRVVISDHADVTDSDALSMWASLQNEQHPRVCDQARVIGTDSDVPSMWLAWGRHGAAWRPASMCARESATRRGAVGAW